MFILASAFSMEDLLRLHNKYTLASYPFHNHPQMGIILHIAIPTFSKVPNSLTSPGVRRH